MMNAPHGKEFVFHDGTKARNLSELVSVLEKISDHDFHHFVTAHKNDFANWIDHVLSDKHLSEKLRTVHSKEDTLHLIKAKISETTIGNSIIKIPRIEDHSVHNTQAHDHHANKDIDNGKDSEHKEHHAEKVDSKDSKEHAETAVHQHSSETKSVNPKHVRNWFKIFSKKNNSEDESIKTEKVEKVGDIKLSKHKIVVDEPLQDDPLQNERENTLWIVLYFALVLLIITLLIYKLFL